MKLPPRLAPLLCLAAAHAAPPAWEAVLPNGSHVDGLALNRAAGVTNPSILENVKGAKGELRLQDVPDLKPAHSHEGIFRVFLKKDGIAMPPDMEGSGPFYVFKSGSVFHLLTPKNFATLFGAPQSKDDVLPYVKAYDKLFFNPLADLILSTSETKGFRKAVPPAVSEVKETADGWEVRAILYSNYRVMAFYEQKLHVGKDGLVQLKEKKKVLQELGPGIMF